MKKKIRKEADVWLNLKYFNNEKHQPKPNVDKGIIVESTRYVSPTSPRSGTFNMK